MLPQEKRHCVMALIQTFDLTIKRPTLYHLSYRARYDSSEASGPPKSLVREVWKLHVKI
jgi:hypothetical protein